MKQIFWLFLLILVVCIPGLERLIPSSKFSGEIVSISETADSPIPFKTATVLREDNTIVEASIYDLNVAYAVGERILLQQDTDESVYSVTGKERTGALFRLFVLFVGVIVIVSGISGVRSLVGLAFSFLVIFKYVLPQIVAGGNPLSIALSASLIILSVSYYLTHGVNHKSTIAIIGTLGALTVTGVLAMVFSSLTTLTGFGTEEAGFLIDRLTLGNFYNLLLAGIILGSLGVLDDITISQTSIVAELSQANKKLGARELYTRAMRIGHDHISSLVNTLVLVYTGSALPLLLLFVTSDASVYELLNYEAVAEEVVRTLVGSIGLVSAVPLTTIIASYWYSTRDGRV